MFNIGEEENLKNFNLYFDKLVERIKDRVVVVTDADETLSTKDTSRIFWKNNFGEKEWLDFRLNFERIGRNFNGFLKAANTYSLINKEEYVKYCMNCSRMVELRHGWSEFIESVPAMIVVTSGIRLIWENVIKLNNWNHLLLIGGNHSALDNFIVSPDIKLEIVKRLQKANKSVIAFGDSRVDAPMLEFADLGVVIANERRSPGLSERLSGMKNICQLQLEELKLDNIPVSSFEEVANKYFN